MLFFILTPIQIIILDSLLINFNIKDGTNDKETRSISPSWRLQKEKTLELVYFYFQSEIF